MTAEHKNALLTPDQQDIFARYFPGAKITTVHPSDVPEKVMQVFEWSSRRFIDPKDYRPLNFIAIYQITYEGGDRNFAARQLKYWKTESAGRPGRHIEYNTQFIDVDSENHILGRSELVLAFPERDKFFKNRPYEEWSGTEENYRRRGLSLRRTVTLNAFSQMMWGLPLYSGTLFVHDRDGGGNEVQPQKLVWEKLVGLGLARKFKQGEHHRFIFKKTRI